MEKLPGNVLQNFCRNNLIFKDWHSSSQENNIAAFGEFITPIYYTIYLL